MILAVWCVLRFTALIQIIRKGLEASQNEGRDTDDDLIDVLTVLNMASGLWVETVNRSWSLLATLGMCFGSLDLWPLSPPLNGVSFDLNRRDRGCQQGAEYFYRLIYLSVLTCLFFSCTCSFSSFTFSHMVLTTDRLFVPIWLNDINLDYMVFCRCSKDWKSALSLFCFLFFPFTTE